MPRFDAHTLSYLKAVTSVGLAVNHIQNFVRNGAAHVVSGSPIVSCTGTLFVHIEVLWVVDILIRTALNAVDDSWLEVEEDCARNVSRVVGLVEEDIFAVAAFGREVFKVAVLIDAMLKAKLPPELRADWRAYQYACDRSVGGIQNPPLLPHWPAWSVMISLRPSVAYQAAIRSEQQILTAACRRSCSAGVVQGEVSVGREDRKSVFLVEDATFGGARWQARRESLTPSPAGARNLVGLGGTCTWYFLRSLSFISSHITSLSNRLFTFLATRNMPPIRQHLRYLNCFACSSIPESPFAPVPNCLSAAAETSKRIR